MKTKALLASLSFTSLAVFATDYQYPTGGAELGYSYKGKPDALTNINASLPGDVLNNIYGMLPEGQPVNPLFIAPDIKSNIEFDQDGIATVTFLNEGAGYRNALGYFLFDTANPPGNRDQIDAHTIVFPNTSKPPEGEMQQGDQLSLNIEVSAGQSLGFFVVPNGWGWRGTYGNIHSDGPWNQPFYSLSSLNPETNISDRRHNVVFVDTDNDLLMIGFDDQLYTQGDKDFNDLLFAVDVTPFEAVDGVNDDGSIDSGSYIPLTQNNGDNDELITSYYPSLNGQATLAFEDRWPHKGDFDYNDVIVRYRMTLTQTTSSKLKSMVIDATVQAMGATYHNGLAWRIPHIGSDNIDSLTLTRNGQQVTHSVTQMDGNDGVFILSEDLRDDVFSNCEMFRTEASCRESENTQYQLSLVLTEPVATSLTGRAPFDPFLFAAEGEYHGELGFTGTPGRQWELHLKTFCGTSEFEPSLLGIYDDNSSASTCYLNDNNIPWAINIADQWDHPREYHDILTVYPQLRSWVESDGYEHTDWYQRSNANQSRLYE